MKRSIYKSAQPQGWAFLALLFSLCFGLQGQNPLEKMPGHARFLKMSRETKGAFKSGALSVTWLEEGRTLEYRRNGKRFRFDVGSLTESEQPAAAAAPPKETKAAPGESEKPEHPARGRQYTRATSPDGKHKAFYRNRNLWLSDPSDTNSAPFVVTTAGNDTNRVKFGTATWVYGEELYQRTAMWWSPDSKKLAFYRFDESQVPDFYLQVNQTTILSTADVEPYVKAGATNPCVDLLVYDVETKSTVTVDVRDGKPFENSVLGHYVYGVEWTADSAELLFHRTNRRQNVMELAAADPNTGKCRAVVREEWLPSWTENTPDLRFLKDGKRFVWSSERTGWKNFYLHDLSGQLCATLTSHDSEVGEIVQIDEAAGHLYYMARTGDNPMKLQLHRVGLDGSGNTRLTDPRFHHQVNLAPDFQHFVDVTQTHDTPPVSSLMDAKGNKLTVLAKSDLSGFKKAKLRPVELFTFKSADLQTDLYGMLHFPSDFHPSKKYPLLVSVYAGPSTTGAHETFGKPDLLTEYGFLIASFDSRSASGRGKRFLDSIYMKLGQVEMDDQAAGVRFLRKRRYVDSKRVGIFGTSYGGTASATCLMRFPDVFHAASSSAPVTDYRNYDSIYAERYMWIPQENREGYDAARIMTYAPNLKGRLMLYYGTADDNVHPNNSMQLIQALQNAGKSFEVQVGPDVGHAGLPRDRMMEFFIDTLILKKRR
jgi:dipeptidyl-peptidase-4